MNAGLRAIASAVVALAASAALAGSSQAVMLAGWDFSQYVGSATLDVNGDFASDNTLAANFSNLDSTFGAGMTGPEGGSDVFGVMLADGTGGSDSLSLGFGAQEIQAVTGNLASNQNAGVPDSAQFSTACPVLQNEGQAFCNDLSLSAVDDFNVVFKADLSSQPGLLGSGWSVSFGGKTFSGSQSVEIDFSVDGVFDAPGELGVATANLTDTDTPFDFALPGADSAMAWVRLQFEAPGSGGLNQAIIDNVAISATQLVPEPGTALLLLSGLMGLAKAGRRRA